MTHDALVVAVILQWALLIVLCGAVFLLLRQVGVLLERLGPAGALTLPGGVEAGEAMPEMELRTLSDDVLRIGGRHPEGLATLIFFLSPTCPVCKSLLPALRATARSHARDTRLVLASDGDEPLQQRMVGEEKLAAYPLVLSSDLGRQLGVSRLPYAALIDGDGKLVAKGLVNSREHLDSLFEAQALGSPSLQHYLGKPRANEVEA